MDKNAWMKILVSALITIMLSVGSSVYLSGKTTGMQEEKISQLEAKVAVIETDKKTSENLLFRIDERLKNVELILKELRDRK